MPLPFPGLADFYVRPAIGLHVGILDGGCVAECKHNGDVVPSARSPTEDARERCSVGYARCTQNCGEGGMTTHSTHASASRSELRWMSGEGSALGMCMTHMEEQRQQSAERRKPVM